MTNSTITDREVILRAITLAHDINGWPLFMPHDGYCTYCHKDITNKIAEKYMLTHKWEIITGCPKCNMSYCE